MSSGEELWWWVKVESNAPSPSTAPATRWYRGRTLQRARWSQSGLEASSPGRSNKPHDRCAQNTTCRLYAGLPSLVGRSAAQAGDWQRGKAEPVRQGVKPTTILQARS